MPKYSVGEAAKLLDKAYPLWHRKIVAPINMGDYSTCIIGQILGINKNTYILSRFEDFEKAFFKITSEHFLHSAEWWKYFAAGDTVKDWMIEVMRRRDAKFLVRARRENR